MKTIVLCSSILLMFSCNNAKKENYQVAETPVVQTAQEHPGKKLMKVHCYTCHDATTAEDKRLAPPMVAVKRRYKMGTDSKNEFIADIQNFIKNPTDENAIMYGAVERFGVMSKMAYPEDVIKKIADYMYDNQLEKPDWFEAHYKKGMKTRNNY